MLGPLANCTISAARNNIWINRRNNRQWRQIAFWRTFLASSLLGIVRELNHQSTVRWDLSLFQIAQNVIQYFMSSGIVIAVSTCNASVDGYDVFEIRNNLVNNLGDCVINIRVQNPYKISAVIWVRSLLYLPSHKQSSFHPAESARHVTSPNQGLSHWAI